MTNSDLSVGGIHDVILDYVEGLLREALITSLPDDDDTRVGSIVQGPLQGDPDPDEARIYIELYENDPHEDFYGGGKWDDEVMEAEVGGVTTHKRRFTAIGRCLLEQTQESLSQARRIASTVRGRIENTLINAPFSNLVADDGERVSLGLLTTSEDFSGKVRQSGGPPDAYDIRIKVRFTVVTTKQGV